MKKGHDKRGTWSKPAPVLRYDAEKFTVTVAGSYGPKVQAGVEDVGFQLILRMLC